MFDLGNSRASHFVPIMTVFAFSFLRLFGFQYQGNIFAMGFFSSAIDGLKTVITAIGAGIGVWGVINLLEGYGNDNAGSLPVHHKLPDFTQTHVHRVSDAIQPSHPLSSPSSPAPNPSQHQSLFQ